MADRHSKETRSFNMSRILSKDTKPELIVRKFLFAHGFRYRLHVKGMPGSPDIVLKRLKVVIFVHGCFWHGHENCKFFVIPKTRTDWWLSKIEANKSRDLQNIQRLKAAGWKTFEIFECYLRKSKVNQTLTELLRKLC